MIITTSFQEELTKGSISCRVWFITEYREQIFTIWPGTVTDHSLFCILKRKIWKRYEFFYPKPIRNCVGHPLWRNVDKDMKIKKRTFSLWFHWQSLLEAFPRFSTLGRLPARTCTRDKGIRKATKHGFHIIHF